MTEYYLYFGFVGKQNCNVNTDYFVLLLKCK